MKLNLAYPLKPWVKTQGFGESYACIDPVTRKTYGKPLGGTCPVGTTDLYAFFGMKGHNGEDAWQPSGAPIHASLEGIVKEVCTEEARGLGVEIVSENKYEVEGGEFQIKHTYWHLKGINVEMGQQIKVGDLIGWVDNTGYSAGDHLHYAIKPQLNNANAFQNNGYFGVIDSAPYWNGTYAVDLQNNTFTKDLKYGMWNLDVLKLQRFLVRNQYGTFLPTGYFGPKTLNAVMAYQRAKKITPVSGYVGPLTRGWLNKEVI